MIDSTTIFQVRRNIVASIISVVNYPMHLLPQSSMRVSLVSSHCYNIKCRLYIAINTIAWPKIVYKKECRYCPLLTYPIAQSELSCSSAILNRCQDWERDDLPWISWLWSRCASKGATRGERQETVTAWYCYQLTRKYLKPQPFTLEIWNAKEQYIF